jgi:hypothetical protein
MTNEPGVAGGLHYLAGWAGAAMRRHPRAEPAVRAHIRRDELRRIGRRVARLARARAAAPVTR